MTKLLEAESGRVLYRLREQMVEPAFGIIERAMGWSQMSMSGLDKATGHRRLDAGDDGVEHQGAACAAGGMMWEMACGNGLWKCKPNGINDDQTSCYGLAPELRLN